MEEILTKFTGPVNVYVFPDPVCPNASTVQEYLEKN